MGERLFWEVSDVSGNVDLGEGITAAEGGLTYVIDEGREVERGEIFTLVEGEVADDFEINGEEDLGEIEAVDEGSLAEFGGPYWRRIEPQPVWPLQ